MKKSFLAALACLAVSALTAKAQLIAGWDFQTTTNGGTAAVTSNASIAAPLVYQANVGVGTIYLNGSNGSSTWNATSEVSGFTGSALNASNGLATTTTSPASLGVIASTGNTSLGKKLVFSFSTSGYTDGISVSYATQRSNSGFTSQVWEYSLDSITWSPLQTVSSVPTSYAVFTLDTFTVVNNLPTAYLRVSFNGASASGGTSRLDNIQIAAVPEPGTVALVGLGLGAVLVGLRRRKA